ncbi:type I restriction endonuclease subunit R [Helcobacillus massiliensis]|uniref:type I restriction endonuclease subunit R n=1 Tax=Helcobacillus massiliensis TaxID=521392 RepID=UPI00255571F2|nr:type I restriction endonuclease [Helcobacillus massiliensis]MDK7741341.1 type I restriction endonuclease [Helcobacillus massiliensis]WOO92808.1 type I restriction endonuclease [Helcobacillus massiliensis]
MSATDLAKEKAFQQEIATHLENHGWLHSPNTQGYDKERALFPADVLAWLSESDPENYERIVPADLTGDARKKAEEKILDRLVRVLAMPEAHGGGTLNVLRKGFSYPGARRPFTMMQMPPADDRNPRLTERYQRNRLRVVQEVVYSTTKTDRIDLVLFTNGIPTATIELKTGFTQSLEAAKQQYRTDRRPDREPLLTALRGALVHFAVSDTAIAMTTRLDGPSTYFLPFDTGHNNGAGNPPNPTGHRTHYFWEDVLDRDAWLTVLAKFIYVNHQERTDPATGDRITSSQIRFPRFHQWRAVNALVHAARREGPGHKYLIQHSAGSGKTDSIAWTAHRLASLHTPGGDKVFDSVIVIADRQVLDRQLQDAVDQLVTTTGTFEAITRADGSKTDQLTDALIRGVPIIGVTLQTFPYALAKMKDSDGQLAGRTFAVIADEAHSSQTGSASSALKQLLYSGEQKADGAPVGDEADADSDQEALTRMAASVDDYGRISFFAFTATPKAKTLELFGRKPSPDEKEQPFDLYPMKQAIEEGFILDVLKNYTSYELAARIARKGEEDLDDEIDIRSGTRAYIKAVELHPTNIDQKVREIIRHFNGVVRHELGGRAKAMVVTKSRAAAVEYARHFQKVSEAEGHDLQALVAFSGEVPDPDVKPVPGVERPTVTEHSMNPRLKGRDLAKVFAEPGEHVLIVANKYQTGFDQPLLVAMYIDKELSGITAVQTLSRLNRTMPGKNNTYVLDFVDQADRIEEAFQEYYEDARIERSSDPELVANMLMKLDSTGIYTQSEVEQVWVTWTKAGAKPAGLSGPLDQAVDRFAKRWQDAIYDGDTKARDELIDFRSTLRQYVTSYAFFSQILNFGDPRYEKFSVFADLLARKLRDFSDDTVEKVDVDVSDIVLTHYKLEKLRDEQLQLRSGEADGLSGITEAGMAQIRERERSSHAAIIEKVNKYFGDLEARDEYKVGFAQGLFAEALDDEKAQSIAAANTKMDFLNTAGMLRIVEDAQWSVDEGNAAVLKFAREMPPQLLLRLLVDEMGLWEALRERAGLDQ